MQSPGGYADAARQDAFCAGTICTITRLYDQSPERNDLGIEPIGGNGSADAGAIANALPVVVDGHHVYGLSVQAGVGYRKYFIWSHVRRHTGLRISPEGAIATIVATQVGEWNENFSGVADRIPFEAVPDRGSSLK